jgi:hypothetical protein
MGGRHLKPEVQTMNNNYAAQHALPPDTAPLRFAAQVKRRPLYCQRQSCALSRPLVKGRWRLWVVEPIGGKIYTT